MIKAKTKMIESTSEAAASEVFAVSDNITPIAIASVDSILQLKEVENLQVVPEKQVKQLIVENKTTNPMSKFFIRLGSYLDSMENFLTEMYSNYMNAIEQKKSLYQTEESDQTQRTSRSKRATRKISDRRKSNNVSLSGAGDNAIGLAVLQALSSGTENVLSTGPSVYQGQVFKDTVRDGDFEVQAGTNVSDPPKWIPFPAGTSGLTYTSGFGMRWGRPHKGIDIAGEVGTPIITPISGVVDFKGDAGSYGNVVFVKSGDTIMEFGHLNSIDVESIGQKLQAGQVIGTLGNTGRSSGPHLHWTIKVNGSAVDPVEWTNTNDPMSATSSFTHEKIETPPLDQESEGGINNQRIMVGEAGTEFVIPMSQMPIFTQLIMEEKIKTLNPYFEPEYGRFDDIGFKRGEGYTNDKMAEGGITFKENHKIAARRLTQFFPGKRYLVAGILGNLEHESPGLKPDVKQYGGGPGRGIAQWEHYPDGGGPYPDSSGSDYGRWQTALDMYGGPVFKSLPQQLDFLKWELDTQHPNADDDSKLPSGFATRKYVVDVPKNVREATYNFMYDYERPDEIAQANWETERLSKAFIFFDNMDKLLGTSNKPKTPPVDPRVQEQIEKNLRDRNTMSPEDFFGTKPVFSSSLNSIPGNEQMQIANETQEQFSIDNAKGQIIALYQPTVYYTES